MKISVYLTLIMALCFSVLQCQTESKSKQIKADVIVYGGTSSAVITAVQVARMGKSVIIVSPDKHLDGLSSSGLGFTDTGRKENYQF